MAVAARGRVAPRSEQVTLKVGGSAGEHEARVVLGYGRGRAMLPKSGLLSSGPRSVAYCSGSLVEWVGLRN
jgi:hypothetical protein